MNKTVIMSAEGKLTSRLLGKAVRTKDSRDEDQPSFNDDLNLFAPLPMPDHVPHESAPTNVKFTRLESTDSQSSMGSLKSEFGGFDSLPTSGRTSPTALDEDYIEVQGELPEGWLVVPSRSVPGTNVYENQHTSERQSWFPTSAAPLTESEYGTDAESFLEHIKPGIDDAVLDQIYNPHDFAGEFVKSKASQNTGNSGARKWAKDWKQGYDEYEPLKSKGSPHIKRGVSTPDIKSPKSPAKSNTKSPRTPKSWKATLRKKLSRKSDLLPPPAIQGYQSNS